MKYFALFIVALLVLIMTTAGISYKAGYSKGVDKTIPIAVKMGWNAALDSVNTIMNEQIKSQSNHCTCLCIDTTKYYLYHK